jgi:glucokinase
VAETLAAADVGASKTLVALVGSRPPGLAGSRPGRWSWLTPPQRFATPRDPGDVARLITRAVRDLAGEQAWPAAAAVAIPGPVDSRQGIVAHLPNLGWHDVPFAAILSGQLGVPVLLDDDARLGGLGEWAAGAGAGTRSLGYVTVSTGIGCGLVVDGEPWAGGHGLAGEFGHIVVDPGGPRCGCGHRGCVEAYAGGLAMSRAARRAWPRARLGDGTPAPRSAGEIFRLARRGDEAAAAIVGDATGALALGLAMIAAVFDPELIVVGGSVALGQRRWIRSVAAASRRRCIAQTGASMRVVSAALAGQSALAGAAEAVVRFTGQAAATPAAAIPAAPPTGGSSRAAGRG